MGSRGPVPKRSDQRRRTNEDPAGPVTRAPAGAAAREADDSKPAIPAASRDWHPLAKRWYWSLKHSGQSAFYEPSDWMQAAVAADMLSRQLFRDEGPSAMMMATWDSMTARLLVTEGDRRRMRLELDRRKPEADPDEVAGVTSMLGWQSKLAGTAGAPGM
jgi:hypothetical protein